MARFEWKRRKPWFSSVIETTEYCHIRDWKETCLVDKMPPSVGVIARGRLTLCQDPQPLFYAGSRAALLKLTKWYI